MWQSPPLCVTIACTQNTYTHRDTHKRPTLSVNLRINAKPNANEFFMSLCILLSYWKISLFDAVVVFWLFLFGTKQILSHTIAKESILRLHQKYFVSMHCVNRKFLLEKLFHFIEISVPFYLFFFFVFFFGGSLVDWIFRMRTTKQQPHWKAMNCEKKEKHQ